MTDSERKEWKEEEISARLKSAVDALTPDVIDRISLDTPQEKVQRQQRKRRFSGGMRLASMAAAACLCLMVLGGGVSAVMNRRVESVIGLDVNPSIELSVNRKEKVLEAEALNSDAEVILDRMDLKNVNLDIAVNALIGSMVKHGYLDELENAILVTVSSENQEKADLLRRDTVRDIETSLDEYQVKAVVYDQQATVTDEVRALSERYGISVGKAYFLQELAAENRLSEEELTAFAAMNMEEIAREIADRSYQVGAKEKKPVQTAPEASPSEAAPETAPPETETLAETEAPTESAAPSAPAVPETAAPVPEETKGRKAKIDDVDYDDGTITVYFKQKVKWKNPTVTVMDESGQRYAAMITDTGRDSCEIRAEGIPGGVSGTFVLGGVSPAENGRFADITGYFETPEIAEGIAPAPEEETEPETETEAETESPETQTPPETAAEPETETAAESRADVTAESSENPEG